MWIVLPATSLATVCIYTVVTVLDYSTGTKPRDMENPF